jgi:hypothetical protein
VVCLLRNGPGGSLEIINNRIVEVTIAEVNVSFIPSTDAGQSNTDLEGCHEQGENL